MAIKMIKETVDFATSAWTKEQKDDLNREITTQMGAVFVCVGLYGAPAAPGRENAIGGDFFTRKV